MPSNFALKSHAKRSGPSESSKVFEIEQCMYNLSEDFIRQSSLNVTTHAGSKCPSTAPSDGSDEIFCITPVAPRVHQLWDILRQPISEEIMKKLCFSEMLLVCDGSDSIVGGAAINVSLIAGEVLAAFSSTRLAFLGRMAESELMSFADRNCHPLQERKCETLVAGSTRQEKQIQLYFDEHHNVTAYRQESDGLHSECFEGILQPSERNCEDGNGQQIIVPDGLQLLLLRYLILTNFVGEVCSQTVDLQGRVGNCIHKISPAVPAAHSKLDGKVSETVKEVRKTIWFSNGSEPEESVSHYSASGRLLRHGWNNSNYILISNPLGNTPPAHIMELERSIKDYVHALSGLVKNHSSLKGLIEDIHCSVKEVDRCNQIINPVLLDIINEI